VFFISVRPSLSSQTPTIHAVPGGGSWNDASTWVENTVPGPDDIVEINGTVSLSADASIAGLTISSGATLQNNNYGSDNITLTVTGDVINNGSIQSHLNWQQGFLVMSVTGDITNNGVWGSRWTELHSTQDRTISGSNTLDNDTAIFDDFTIFGNPVFSKNFNFNGHTINAGDANTTLTFNNTSGTGVVTGNPKIYFTGGFSGTVTAAQAIFENGSSINGTLNAAVTVATSSTANLGSSNTINGSLTISSGATLQNNNDGSNAVTLTVNGSVINNGSILSHLNWQQGFLTMSVTGDITNNGVWNSRWTDLRSTQDRTITGANPLNSDITIYDDFTVFGHPVFAQAFNFNGHTINTGDASTTITFFNTSGNGIITGNSNVYFTGSFTGMLTSAQAIFETGSTINGIIDGAVTVAATSTLYTGDSPIINGSLTVEPGATIQNTGYNYQTLTVNGRVVNNGNIVSHINWWEGYLTMSVTGDITNNGIWRSTWTDLRSNQARTIDCTNAIDSDTALQDDFTVTGNPTFSKNFNFNSHTLQIVSPNIITFKDVSGNGVIVGNSNVVINGGWTGTIEADNARLYFIGSLSGLATAAQAFFEDGSSINGTITAPVTVEASSTTYVVSSSTINGSLTIGSGATLENNNGGNDAITLGVNGNVTNNGSILSHLNWQQGFLTMAVTGDITNNGVWNSRWTNLTSSQTRTLSGSNPINSETTLYNDFTFLGNPVFSNNFHFNGHTLNAGDTNTTITLNNSSDTGVITGNAKIYFTGGFSGMVTAAQAFFENGSTINGTVNADVTVMASSTLTTGDNPVINGSLTVEPAAAIQNTGYNNQTLTVNGGVINNGNINSHINWWEGYLTMSVAGDITNNGTWNSRWTYLIWPEISGANDYEINLSDDNHNWPDSATTTNTFYDISSLVNSPHYWRVRADLGNGLYSPWSNVKSINGYQFIVSTSEISGRPIMATAPFNLTLQTRDINGNSFPYNGSVALSASNDATVTPSTITMVNGYWSGTSSIAEFGNAVYLTATSGGGSGSSDSLTVAKKPVIIVPGIISSYLNKNVPGLPEVWPNITMMLIPGSDSYLDDLKMDQYGEPLLSSLMRPTDIFRSVYGKDVFQGLITELTTYGGYTENTNLFVFPYDWRRDITWIASSSPYALSESLRAKIQEVKDNTGAQQVDIIAHSMGGLVVKDYIMHSSTNFIDKFIDIATPHLGSPKAAKVLLYGDNFSFETLFGLLGLNEDKMKEISQNFPSAYELLPSRNYFDASSTDYNSYINDEYDQYNSGVSGPLDYDQSITFLSHAGGNSSMAAMNDTLHDDLDNFNPNDYGVKAYNIVGCSQPTIGSIEIINHYDSNIYEYGLHYIKGDGTVPLKSAEALTNTVATYYNTDESTSTDDTHAFLASLNGDKQLISAILNNSVDQFNFSSYPLSQSSADCSEPLNGWEVSYHSPIALHIYDEKGNHIGPDAKGNIEINIPGAAYDVIGDNKFAFIPKGHNYKITGQATGLGHFNARIQDIQKGQTVSTAYYNDVPLKSTSTNIEIDFANNKPNYAMKMDQTGTKVFKEKIQPSAMLNAKESADRVKPDTQASISGQTIKLTSSDDNSKVLKTEYSLDQGKTWNLYTKPLNIPDVTTIQYRSTDKAGNIEDPKEETINHFTKPSLSNFRRIRF
jgi:cytoskeletal protein CcmA (bactofilin family)